MCRTIYQLHREKEKLCVRERERKCMTISVGSVRIWCDSKMCACKWVCVYGIWERDSVSVKHCNVAIEWRTLHDSDYYATNLEIENMRFMDTLAWPWKYSKRRTIENALLMNLIGVLMREIIEIRREVRPSKSFLPAVSLFLL